MKIVIYANEHEKKVLERSVESNTFIDELRGLMCEQANAHICENCHSCTECYLKTTISIKDSTDATNNSNN